MYKTLSCCLGLCCSFVTFINVSSIAADATTIKGPSIAIEENTDYLQLAEIIKKYSITKGFPIVPDTDKDEEDKLIALAARLLNAPKENIKKIVEAINTTSRKIQSLPLPLSWWTTPDLEDLEDRFLMILREVIDIERLHKSREKQLVITTIGEEGLLQTFYLVNVISLLGYENIHINAIGYEILQKFAEVNRIGDRGIPRSSALFPYSHPEDPKLRELILGLFKNIDRSKQIEITVYYTALEYVFAVTAGLAFRSDCFDAFLYNESDNYYYVLSGSAYSKLLRLPELLTLLHEITIVPAEVSGYDGRLIPTHFRDPLEKITICYNSSSSHASLNKSGKQLTLPQLEQILSDYDKQPNIVFVVKVKRNEDEFLWLIKKTKKVAETPIAYRYGFAPDTVKSIYQYN